jgi:hypothetical protein
MNSSCRAMATAFAALLIGAVAMPSTWARPLPPPPKPPPPKVKEERKEKAQEHRALVKDRIADLKQKEKDGTLTPEEKADLERLTKRVEVIKEHRQQWQEIKDKRIEKLRDARRAFLEKYGPIHKRPRVNAELTKHAKRMAQLRYMRVVAEEHDNDKAVERIDKLLGIEQGRHDKRMDVLKGEKE